ncbi:cytochrome-c oxidase [Sphingobium sp. 22B]|uniref:cytochrome c oxidase subunit II n=1 Tax=unclassified Sphingobium TaxID=2611147 RepID=UPI0007816912|nr:MULTISPECIES: cytochrome-c oxidase [unclassified Sphingobium]KXU29504.1 cytochrome-c oxidase [Sphingobium sp. AM]KYC30066.1 cytochrome-c oxidase [Sphingobium sp. 22B]OAP29682.1 cytochrome-c oxidase [Sphingobium sp. 20006FA]
MPVAVAIAMLVVGSVAFHLFSPWWRTPIASNWGSIDSALDVTLWICGAAFVGLNLFLAWALVKYRHRPGHRPGHRAHYEPENPSLERRLTFWTAIGIAGMLAPGLAAWGKYVSVPKEATVIEAVGQQWQWSFRYPGPDGVLGAAGVKYITPDNGLGLDPLDPFGRDDILVESSDLHLPVGKPVKIVLRSKDVLHDFYVPEFRAKMDLVPGIVTYFWLTPTKTGTFDILCAELCGTGHHAMRGKVVVETPQAFAQWQAQQSSFGQILAEAPPAAMSILLIKANACIVPASWSIR